MDTDRKRGRIGLNHEVRRDISIQFRVNKAEFDYLKELVEASGLERKRSLHPKGDFKL
ncbi:hypothetical protein [Klebsiella pneumoniae]|uniref:hypothetical protein n=1 Tax=Klebsiella pneumoniae TaxID=573 RepID=UPI003CF297B7